MSEALNPQTGNEVGGAVSKEQQKLLDRLTSLVRTVSADKSLKVVTEVGPITYSKLAREGKNPDREWFVNQVYDEDKKLVERYVHIPKEIVENTNVARGKVTHEAGHIAITRYGQFIPDEVLQQLGFHSLIAALEERPTDQVVRNRYSGAGRWVDEARVSSLAEITEINKLPKFLQLSELVVYEKFRDREALQLYDTDVLEVFGKVRKEISKLEKTLPKERDSEEEITQKSKERYKIAYKKIWPQVKKLVKKDIEEEAVRMSAKKGSESKENEQENNETSESKVRSEEKESNEEQNSHNKDQKENSQSKKEGKGEKEQQEGEKMDQGKPSSQDNPDRQGLKEKLSGLTKKQGKTTEASKDGDQKKQKETFDKLSREEKKKLVLEAAKSLENREDVFTEDISAKINDFPTETHEQFRVRIQKEKEREALEELVKTLEAFEIESGDYDKVYSQVRELDEILYNKLEAVLRPNIKRQVVLKDTGAKINLPSVFRRESEKSAGVEDIESRIFETPRFPEKKDYAFTLLVDLSGSMSGGKIKETLKGVVLLVEVLNRLGIKNEILGFQDELIIFKRFDENLSDTVRKKISGMEPETSSSNPGGHNAASYNDDGPCLSEASHRLEGRGEKEKVLVVLSDGNPAGRRSSSKDLEEAVKKIVKNSSQKLIGVGLGKGTRHVEHYYPVSIPEVEIQNLPQIFSDLLEKMLLNSGEFQTKME